MRFGTMGTTSPELREKGTGGPTMSQPTHLEDSGTITEAL
jgi:hypothetical protein